MFIMLNICMFNHLNINKQCIRYRLHNRIMINCDTKNFQIIKLLESNSFYMIFKLLVIVNSEKCRNWFFYLCFQVSDSTF